MRAPDDGGHSEEEGEKDKKVEEGESKQEGAAKGLQVWFY
jgi:hypothetical protein